MRDIYADESSQTKHRFLALGALTARTDTVPEIIRAIQAARLPSLPQGEMKWTKVSSGKLEAYRSVVDAFFSLSDQDLLHFHAILIDTSRLNHARFNQGDKEIGFSKMVFQLLNKHCRLYPERLYAYLDSRTTRQSLDDLKMILNRNASRKHSRTDNPFRRVVFRDSKQSDLLQLNDVLLGSVAWVKNGHGNRSEASSSKNDLASYIMSKADLRSLDINTPPSRKRFTIWNFKLS
jgi:hypothetical protein